MEIKDDLRKQSRQKSPIFFRRKWKFWRRRCWQKWLLKQLLLRSQGCLHQFIVGNYYIEENYNCQDKKVHKIFFENLNNIYLLRSCKTVFRYKTVGFEKGHKHCDQIGLFFKRLGDKCSYKSSPYIWQLFGLFRKMLICKLNYTTPRFWATLRENWTIFNSNI